MHWFFSLVLFSTIVWGQHSEQPSAEETTDLRKQTIIFSLEKSDSIIWLERTASLDYFLRNKEGDSLKLQKIDSRSAKAMEMDFASKFIKYQFEVTPEHCDIVLKISLQGEEQNVCKKDDKKAREFLSAFSELLKKF